jgi:probable O-glycosylation ligase (exosortase A-associated)
MLRTAFVIVLLLIGIRYSLKGAFYMLLLYLWIAYFRPDAWLWSGWFGQANLSFLAGFAVVVATLFSGQRFRLGIGQVLMLAFLLLALLSYAFSPFDHGEIWPSLADFVRVIVVNLIIIALVTTEDRLRLTLVVIAASLGFDFAKQGWALLILSPGASSTNGSPFLGDNNGVAVGLLALVPLITVVAATASRRWERYAWWTLAMGVIYRAIVTYSRGGFLSATALGLHYLMRAKHKFRALLGIAVVAGVLYQALPVDFWNRIGTLQTAATADLKDLNEVDMSMSGRVFFWQIAMQMANDRPLLGVGFNAYNLAYDSYDVSHGAFGLHRSVHSIWFGLISELGYFGLVIFVLILMRAVFVNWRARRAAKYRPDLVRLVGYGTALEASLLVYSVGGSFVPHQYNEMLWHILALTIAFEGIVRDRLAQSLAPPVPVHRTAIFDVPVRVSGRLRPT